MQILKRYITAIKIAGLILVVTGFILLGVLLNNSYERNDQLTKDLADISAKAELCSNGVEDLKKEQAKVTKDLKIQIGRQKDIIDFYTDQSASILISKPMGKDSCESANLLINQVIQKRVK